MLPDCLSPRRWKLCGREHADRLARRLCDNGDSGFSVVRNPCALQPYKVVRRGEGDPDAVELEVVVL
jgi:hypothetical protein